MKSIDLAYWIGVAQTDGYFKRYYYKKKKVFRHLVSLNVGYPSIPMLEKFRTISQNIFKLKGSTWHNVKNATVEYKIGAKNLLPIFNQLNIDFSDPPKPPRWIIENKEFFGAYLAGVIDGDGSVRIRRPQYPQCAVRITSGSYAVNLRQAIVSSLNIGVSRSINHSSSIYKGRKIEGTAYNIEFYVSPKNFNFFHNCVIPQMAISRKRDKISVYIERRTVGREPN